MNEANLDALLAQRGYRRIHYPSDPSLWVAPIRAGAMATKLLYVWDGLEEDGLHFLLDHYVELKAEGYTNEQRAEHVLCMSLNAKPYPDEYKKEASR